MSSSFQPGANLYTAAFGTRPENVEVPHIDSRAPASTDVLYPIGKKWVNTVSNNTYTLTSFTSALAVVSANWIVEGGSSTVLSVAGTANQITATNVSGAVTLSTPSSFVAPGSITATTTLTATSGAITATNGNLVLSTAGNKLSIATGANASIGSAVLVGGTVTVATTAVTASSKIFLTVGALGTVLVAKAVHADTIVAGTSFDITSADVTDTSTVNWLIIN